MRSSGSESDGSSSASSTSMGVGVPGAGLSGGSDGPALSWAAGVVGAIDEVGWRGSGGGDDCGFCLSAREVL